MFLAWLICISLFIGGYLLTMFIFDRLKEKDQSDLAALETQLQNMTKNHPQTMKQAV